MGTPHVHSECIKAWADGKQIEFFSPASGNWYPASDPNWHTSTKYRVKPETIRYRVALFRDCMGGFHTDNAANNGSDEGAIQSCSSFIRWLTDWQEVEV